MKWLPANSTEFELFVEAFCDKCRKGENCSILDGVFLGDSPKEWLCNTPDIPYCTAYDDEEEEETTCLLI